MITKYLKKGDILNFANGSTLTIPQDGHYEIRGELVQEVKYDLNKFFKFEGEDQKEFRDFFTYAERPTLSQKLKEIISKWRKK